MDNTINFAEEFKRYWKDKGSYLSVNNKTRTMENMCTWLEDCHSTEDIDDHVINMKTRKESIRRIILDFYRYLKRNHSDMHIDSSLKEKRFFDSPMERRLEIAKYLHEPHSGKEIEEAFDIKYETRKKDLQALKEGLDVFGVTIQLDTHRKGRKTYYKTTVHPIFLPLNLTEVYAMTAYLERVLDIRDPNSDVVEKVIDRIKAQLSDYAFKTIYGCEKPLRYANYYLDDEKLAKSREGIYLYLEKSGKKCTFIYKGEHYIGKIRRNGVIELENGEILDADLRSVEFVIDSLEY